MSRLAVLKALGDDTRYAIYLELAHSQMPRSTSEIAEVLGLHINTVRPQLERMREVGLLQVDAEPTGGVGRPQHRYSLAPGAPALGVDPLPCLVLTRALLRAVVAAGLDSERLTEAGRDLGRESARRLPPGSDPLDALMDEQVHLGFGPTLASHDRRIEIEFGHCPLLELAEVYPDLVCGLHSGLVEGFVAESSGGRAETTFSSLVDRSPCRVTLVA